VVEYLNWFMAKKDPFMEQKQGLSFDDIILIPRYSTLRSRSEADTSVSFWKYTRPNPIISANMKTVTGPDMAIAVWESGGTGALHRFWEIEENVQAYQSVVEKQADCFVSIGVNNDYKDRTKALYDAGARMFIIDIAHGHSIMMKQTIEWLREEYKEEIYIVAGNVATGQATKDLIEWGADAVKCGIGPGSLCTTRLVTGHGVPTVTAIHECQYWTNHLNKMLIADGGIRFSGDIVKSIALGADMVMLGGLFAGAEESPSPVVGGKKLYQGSAAVPVRAGVTPEGASAHIPVVGTVSKIIDNLVGGLRSGMSYSDAHSLNELKVKSRYTIQTNSSFHEGTPHILKNIV